MTYFLIVHQPGCSNVVELDGRFGGTAKRRFQGPRAEARGYLQAMLDQGGERYSKDAICPPGDCLKHEWKIADPPLTWSEDCREWAA